MEHLTNEEWISLVGKQATKRGLVSIIVSQTEIHSANGTGKDIDVQGAVLPDGAMTLAFHLTADQREKLPAVAPGDAEPADEHGVGEVCPMCGGVGATKRMADA
jgi:hypothetical protein